MGAILLIFIYTEKEMRFFISAIIIFVVCFSCQNKANMPVAIEVPTSVKPVTINTDDSSYFLLKILNNGIQANLAGKRALITDSIKLDEFIAQNKSLINPNKILLKGNLNNAGYAKFKMAVAVLKRYNYLKFQMIGN